MTYLQQLVLFFNLYFNFIYNIFLKFSNSYFIFIKIYRSFLNKYLSWEKVKVFLKTSTLLIYIIGLQIFILILTIWKRVSRQRTRIDKLNSYTWKRRLFIC